MLPWAYFDVRIKRTFLRKIVPSPSSNRSYFYQIIYKNDLVRHLRYLSLLFETRQDKHIASFQGAHHVGLPQRLQFGEALVNGCIVYRYFMAVFQQCLNGHSGNFLFDHGIHKNGYW